MLHGPCQLLYWDSIAVVQYLNTLIHTLLTRLCFAFPLEKAELGWAEPACLLACGVP